MHPLSKIGGQGARVCDTAAGRYLLFADASNNDLVRLAPFRAPSNDGEQRFDGELEARRRMIDALRCIPNMLGGFTT
jgi:hypothetical protein